MVYLPMEREEVYQFVSNYHRLYLKRHAGMTASNYDKLELQAHEPPDILKECYRKLQEDAYSALKSSEIEDVDQFVETLEVAQYYPKLSVMSIASQLSKHLEHIEPKKELPRTLVALSSIYRMRFDLKEDSAVLEQTLERLTDSLSPETDLSTTCYALGKMKIIGDRLVDRLEIAIEEASHKTTTNKKQLLFNTLDLYSRLPQRYYPHRLNSFFMDALNRYPLHLNEKVRVLTALSRLDDIESSQFRLISPEVLNLFLMDIVTHNIDSLNMHSRLRLFNLLRQSSNNQQQLHQLNILTEDNIKYLQRAYLQNQRSTVSLFHEDVGKCLTEIGYTHHKEIFLETYFVDFLVERPQGKTVLEVDGPSHFWKVENNFLANRDNCKREGWWHSRGYSFGSVPFYLWSKCTTGAHKRVLVRSAVDGKQP